MIRRSARLAAAVVFAAIGVLTFAGAASAASVGGLGVRPSHFDPNDPDTRAYFKRDVAPGGSFSDSVTVTNTSDAPLTVYVSAVDGLTSQTSGAVYANRTDPVSETGAWVTTGSSTLTIAPHGETQVPFTVHVPSDAVAGDHLAGLAFEDTTPHTSGGNFSVTQVLRAVVGVEVHVSGDAAFRMSPGTPTLLELPGTANAAVVVPLTNTGGLLGKPSLTVSLTSDDGGYKRSVERSLDTILPGDHIDYPFVWPDDLAPGRYRIAVEVSGAESVVASKGASTLGHRLAGAANPGASKHVTVVVSGSHNGPSMALLISVVAGLVLVLVLGMEHARRLLRSRLA